MQLIANDCYKMGAFLYAARAFDVLERLDPNPEYWEGKRGACVGAFQGAYPRALRCAPPQPTCEWSGRFTCCAQRFYSVPPDTLWRLWRCADEYSAYPMARPYSPEYRLQGVLGH